MVGLASASGKPATALSGGQQQRVALARALVHEPRLVLFDEPMSNLDARLRAHMRMELAVLQERLGFTAVYVTHDQTEAFSLAETVAVMNHGRIETIGDPRSVFARPKTPFVAEFLGLNVNRGKALRSHPAPDGAHFVEVALSEAFSLWGVLGGATPPPAGTRVIACTRKEHIGVDKPGAAVGRSGGGAGCASAARATVLRGGAGRVLSRPGGGVYRRDRRRDPRRHPVAARPSCRRGGRGHHPAGGLHRLRRRRRASVKDEHLDAPSGRTTEVTGGQAMNDRLKAPAARFAAAIVLALAAVMPARAAVLDAQDTARLVAINEAIASFENDVGSALHNLKPEDADQIESYAYVELNLEAAHERLNTVFMLAAVSIYVESATDQALLLQLMRGQLLTRSRNYLDEKKDAIASMAAAHPDNKVFAEYSRRANAILGDRAIPLLEELDRRIGAAPR